MNVARRLQLRLSMLAAGLAVAAGIAATRDRWWIVAAAFLAASAGGYLVAAVRGTNDADVPDGRPSD